MMKNSKSHNVFPLIVISVFVTAMIAKFAYENRCHVINCSPASWETILDMAFAHSENDFRIDTIWATPSRWTSYTEAGPTFIDINISYTSPTIDSSRADQNINHPIKHLEFDDQTLITDIRAGNSWSNSVPPEDRREILQRVRVHPRDAFRSTWALAKSESGLSPDKANVLAILSFDTHGYESAWFVSYYYDDIVTVNFYIDAQTPKIISVEKNDLSQ